MANKSGMSAEQLVEQAEKQRQALELRKAGATFEQIAKQLGYANGGGAYKVVQAGLKALVQQPADEVRQLEVERLDAMLRALWPDAMSGKPQVIDRCLGIMDRRAKLLGLDAPLRIEEHVITEDAIDAEMRRLSEQIAERGGAVPVE